MTTHPSPAPSAGPGHPSSGQGLTRPEKLGRLPYTREHTRLLLGSGTGWALDAMDVGLISFVMAALAAEWHLTKGDTGLLASVGFLGMALGATFGGLLADRLGRRTVFAATLLLYGLATGASALAGSLAVLMAFRFVVGLGLGAELPVASTLVSELSPARLRGRMVVVLESFWALGWILAAVIGWTVVPLDDGWRWAFALGVIPALYAAVVRFGLPESVHFLERAGRHAEADEVVARFERSAGVPPTPTRDLPPRQAALPGQLWSKAHRARTAGIWAIWFCVNLAYYGAFIWLPTLLHERGFELVRAFGYTLLMTLAQLPGYALAAVLIEVWGRRATLATFLVGSALSAWAFGQAGSTAQVLWAGAALSFFNLGAWGALYAVTPEIYPTTVRGTGTGAAAGFGRIASILAPLSVPVLLPRIGEQGVFAVFAAAFTIAALACALLPERTGQALEA